MTLLKSYEGLHSPPVDSYPHVLQEARIVFISTVLSKPESLPGSHSADGRPGVRTASCGALTQEPDAAPHLHASVQTMPGASSCVLPLELPPKQMWHVLQLSVPGANGPYMPCRRTGLTAALHTEVMPSQVPGAWRLDCACTLSWHLHSLPCAGPPGLDSGMGWWRNPKRFNVAITRAKALLVVIGHPVVLWQVRRFMPPPSCCRHSPLPSAC